MDERLTHIASVQHGVFSRQQAREIGIGRSTLAHQVDRRHLDRIADHVFRIAGSTPTDRSHLMATVLSAGPDAVASSSAALALQAIRDFDVRPALVVVGRRPPRSALPGVRESFRLLDHHHVVIDGIPCATVARALLDYARDATRRQTARAVDAALAARKTTRAELQRILDELAVSGRSGVVNIREILAERPDGYEAPRSRLEAEFIDLISESGFPAPERQVELGSRFGWVGTVDFAWPRAQLIVEVDGDTFHNSLTDRENDERRDRALEIEGWQVLRFGWNDVMHRKTSVSRMLRTALRHAA